MSKNVFLKTFVSWASFVSIVLLAGCTGKSKQVKMEVPEELPVHSELKGKSKLHSWYYFTDNSIEEIDLPQHVPERQKKAWTESVRISSAGSVPVKLNTTDFDAYGIVNKTGIIAFKDGVPTLFEETSIFTKSSADTLVFSDTTPVFYLYRNRFFNDDAGTKLDTIQKSRPALVEFDPQSKLCYPLVSYENLNLKDNDEITGFFWNGSEWACSVKSFLDTGVEFSYFAWTPQVSITDLEPSFNKDKFTFTSCDEQRYRWLNSPRLFEEAPKVLKELLSYIPQTVSFYVSYRDDSGTSPVSYYQEGTSEITLNARVVSSPASGYLAAVFEDGTTYVKKKNVDSVSAFRLPKLPGGFKYSEVCVSGGFLIVGWEETDFYNTGKSGFIKVNLPEIIK